MKSALFFTFIFVFHFSMVSAQDEIWTKQTKIAAVIAFEKALNPQAKFLSQNVTLSKSYYPLIDKYEVDNPIIVQRDPVGYFPIYAEYFFTPNDSILRLVSYDWEKGRYDNFFDKQKIWEAESNQLARYNKEYERIRALLIVQFGEPTSTDKAPKKNKSDRGRYLTRKSLWEDENVHADLNMIFESTTYRIRLTIYWKQ